MSLFNASLFIMAWFAKHFLIKGSVQSEVCIAAVYNNNYSRKLLKSVDDEEEFFLIDIIPL